MSTSKTENDKNPIEGKTEQLSINTFKGFRKDLKLEIANEFYKANPVEFLKAAMEFREMEVYQHFPIIPKEVKLSVDVLTQQTISAYSMHIDPLLMSNSKN